MLNQLGVLFACLCVLGGAALLYQGFSIPDASQTMELLAGASLFAVRSGALQARGEDLA
jgi:hypothetical protein